MLNSKNQLRAVVKIWENEAKPNQNKKPAEEEAARKSLQAAFDELGN
jgi:hypothetical protein